MTYVDGFLLPLPTEGIKDYQAMAAEAGKVWMEHGALAYKECLANDIDSEMARGFAKAAGAKEGETVVFAFIVYRSREDRDRINPKVWADPRIQQMCPDNNPDLKLPFDMTRMAFGGFEAIVDL